MWLSKGWAALGVAIGFSLAVASGPVEAQDYPSKPIRVIVPSAVGGSWDIEARMLQPLLQERLGQPIVVLNVSTGGPAIAARQLKDAEPDGYTILIIHVAMATAYALGQTEFTHRDLEPIVQTSHDGLIGTVAYDAPWPTARELVAAAKAKPGSVLHSANIGGVGHFAPLLFANKAGIEFRFVQTGGQGTSNAALLGGHVHVGQNTVSGARGLFEAKQARPLWVLSAEREPTFPQIPTAREQGIDAVFATDIWWFAPKGIAPDRLAKLQDTFEAVMKDPRTIDAYQKRDLAIAFLRGPALLAKMDADFATVVDLAKQAGLYRGK